jgi:hypothetical protein
MVCFEFTLLIVQQCSGKLSFTFYQQCIRATIHTQTNQGGNRTFISKLLHSSWHCFSKPSSRATSRSSWMTHLDNCHLSTSPLSLSEHASSRVLRKLSASVRLSWRRVCAAVCVCTHACMCVFVPGGDFLENVNAWLLANVVYVCVYLCRYVCMHACMCAGCTLLCGSVGGCVGQLSGSRTMQLSVIWPN